jgi:NAD(P)H-dependent FMN reductase
MKKIIAFAGSNSSKSINHQLILASSKLTSNVVTEIINLRDFEAPLFGADLLESNGIPESMIELSEKMKSADGFLISIAEHNGSMTAVLKNTFDWLSMKEPKFLFNKPTVFISTSPGPRGAASALKHIVEIMPYRGANIIGSHSVGSFSEKVADGKFINEDDKATVENLLTELTDSL